jgi:hypothetical protein
MVETMVEEKTRGEQLFGQAKDSRASSGQAGSLKDKLIKTLIEARGFFVNPQASEENVGGGKSASGVKKPSPAVPAGFGPRGLDLKFVNQVLVGILALLAVLTVYVALRERPDIASVTAAISKIKFQEFEAKAVETFQPEAFYLEQVKTRDIFDEYKRKEDSPPPVDIVKVEEPLPPPPPKITIQDKAKNFKLMGISWGELPKVIIRNETSQEMFFLNSGDTIKDTNITIKEIMKTGIILTSEGEEMTLL